MYLLKEKIKKFRPDVSLGKYNVVKFNRIDYTIGKLLLDLAAGSTYSKYER